MEVGGGETVEQVAKRLEAKSEYASLRGTLVVVLFLALWGVDLHLFKLSHIDITCIYPAKLIGELPTGIPERMGIGRTRELTRAGACLPSRRSAA
jgi:hypothetical protein